MSKALITRLLTKLSGTRDILKKKIASRDKIIAKSKQLAALNSDIETLQKDCTIAEQEIKAKVLVLGETVSHNGMSAVYNEGRETWDTKALAGYAASNPAINQFKKTGTPFVSIKEDK